MTSTCSFNILPTDTGQAQRLRAEASPTGTSPSLDGFAHESTRIKWLWCIYTRRSMPMPCKCILQPWSGSLKSAQLFLILACCRPKRREIDVSSLQAYYIRQQGTYVSKDARISTQPQLVMQDRTMLLTLCATFACFICKRLIPQISIGSLPRGFRLWWKNRKNTTFPSINLSHAPRLGIVGTRKQTKWRSK